MKKKIFKITAIVITSLIVLGFTTLLVAPKIARSYIVGHSQELIGRDIQIKSISLNPFTFKFTIDSLTVLEQDGKTPFVSFDKFRLNVDPLRLLGKTAAISELYIGHFYAHVIQNGSIFNFSDILEHLNKRNADSTASKDDSSSQAQDSSAVATAEQTATAPDAAKTDSTTASINIAKMMNELPVQFDIKNIKFDNWTLSYEDKQLGSSIKLDSFAIDIPSVNFYDTATVATIRFKFTEGGELKINAETNFATSDFHVGLEIDQLALFYGHPYLKDILHYKDYSGTFTTFLNADGNLNQALAANITGFVAIDSLKLTETTGEKLAIGRINIAASEVNIKKSRYIADSVIIDGALAHFNMYKNGKNNFDALLASTSKDTTRADTAKTKTVALKVEETAPISQTQTKDTIPSQQAKESEQESKLQLLVKKFQLKNSSFTLNDMTIVKPFHYNISGITISGDNINLDSPCHLNVSLALPEGGAITAKYTGAFSNTSTLDANVNIKNLALKHFSNYSLHYTGYPITGGILAFASDNKLVKNKIDSKNIIDIYNIEVGDKSDDIDPEFTVPMKVGLYILKDRHNKIQFNIPVKGSLDDPEFSYGKIIWNTVMNLLIKVAFSPFKLIGNLAASGASALGFDLGNKDEILIDANVATFTSEQYAKAIQMTEMLKKDRKFKLTFTQYYNPTKTAAEYQKYKMKEDFYKTTQHKKSLSEIDRNAIAEISDSDKQLQEYAKTQKTMNPAQLQKEVAALAAKRNAELAKVLQKQRGVGAKRIKVVTAGKEALSSYNGKPTYKVTVDIQ